MPTLEALFNPRSVAVIGASRQRGTVGGEIFHNLLSVGFLGPVYPVNPTAEHVQSVKAYRSVRELSGLVDLAIIAAPAAVVAGLVDDCIAAGVRGIVVISAGFGETGPEGKAVERQILRRCREHGVRLVGPNCLGLLNTDPTVRLDATFAPTWPPRGDVAFASQSGALGLAALDLAKDLGIGIRQFVSVGNKADVSGNDLLEHWEDDDATKVILLYLESLGNPRRFLEVAQRVSKKKPIVAVKSGRTTSGARAAGSHTGALATPDRAIDALFAQTGVIRVSTVKELLDVATLLSSQPVPRGSRVAILTNAGGPAIMAADSCEALGLTLPAPASATQAALRQFLPGEATLQNPIDMIASANAEAYERALEALLADPGFDAVLVLFVPSLVTEPRLVAEAIVRAATGAPKPILTCIMGTHDLPPALEVLRAGRLPAYRFPEDAVAALGRTAAHGAFRARPEGAAPPRLTVDAGAARAALSAPPPPSGWLPPDTVRAVLAAYGIRMPSSLTAKTPEAAGRAAQRLGFPVALKSVSSTLIHKADIGGVVLGLEDAEAVERAAAAMRDRLVTAGKGQALEAFLVQEMVPSGVETLVGLTRHDELGALVAFGIGGTNVEVFNDVGFRLAPLAPADIEALFAQLRAKQLLEGYRGRPPADRAAIADVLQRVSQLALELPEIIELDINPLVALPPGRGVLAVDARLRVRT